MDKKPLYELIIEYKAEVVEEVTEEIEEESVSVQFLLHEKCTIFFCKITDYYDFFLKVFF